jgi:hypothetical protein
MHETAGVKVILIGIHLVGAYVYSFFFYTWCLIDRDECQN